MSDHDPLLKHARRRESLIRGMHGGPSARDLVLADLLRDLSAQLEAAEALRDRLQGYAQHKPDCRVTVCDNCGHVQGVHDHGWEAAPQPICPVFAPKPCTCGLAALLAGEPEK